MDGPEVGYPYSVHGGHGISINIKDLNECGIHVAHKSSRPTPAL